MKSIRINKAEKSNVELYESRQEPPGLKCGGTYVNLRTCDDAETLRYAVGVLERLSKNRAKEYVLVPWLSPPFGEIVGYGTYAREEAENLTSRAQKEDWGFPEFGRIYTKSRLQKRLGDLSTIKV